MRLNSLSGKQKQKKLTLSPKPDTSQGVSENLNIWDETENLISDTRPWKILSETGREVDEYCTHLPNSGCTYHPNFGVDYCPEDSNLQVLMTMLNGP